MKSFHKRRVPNDRNKKVVEGFPHSPAVKIIKKNYIIINLK